MAILRRTSEPFPRQWNPATVPTWPVELDTTHPLGANAQSFVIPGYRYTTDLTARSQVSYVGAPPTVASSFGPVIQLNSSGYQYPSIAGVLQFGQCTFRIGVMFSAAALTSSSAKIYENTPSDGTQSFAATMVSGVLQVDVVTASPLAQNTLNAATTFVANKWYDLCVTYDGANLRLYVNGAQDANSPVSSAGALRNDPTTNLTIGSTSGGSGQQLIGSVRDWILYNRVLTPGAIAQLAAQPFAMLRPIIRRQYYASSTTGTSFTATPGIGLLATSGHALTVSAGATTQPGHGSTTVSGAVPILSAGASLALGIGTLRLTGATPSASAGATVAPGAGLLALTGHAASVSAGAILAPGAGALRLTGYTPTLSAGSTFAANPGAGLLSFVGGAPTVSAGASVTPGAGLIGIPGAAPGVSAGASLPCGMGVLTITGFAPTLSAGINVTVSPGVGLLTFAGFAPTVSTATIYPPFTPDPRRTGIIPASSRFGTIPRSSRFGAVGD